MPRGWRLADCGAHCRGKARPLQNQNPVQRRPDRALQRKNRVYGLRIPPNKVRRASCWPKLRHLFHVECAVRRCGARKCCGIIATLSR